MSKPNLWYVQIFAASLLLIVAATHPAASDPTQQWHGQYATTPESEVIVATDARLWRNILTTAKPTTQQFPAFDPAHKVGVGIFLGRRPTGGYGVEIVSMGLSKDKFVIVIDEIKPGGSIVTQALTSPWTILLIDKPDLPVEVEPRFHAN